MKGHYTFYQANDAVVNYSVTYNTYSTGCGVTITNYSSNINPSSSETIDQCTLSWQNGGYNYVPDVRIPNFYPNDSQYSTTLGWTGGGGSTFYTYAGLGGCSFYDSSAYGYVTLNN